MEFGNTNEVNTVEEGQGRAPGVCGGRVRVGHEGFFQEEENKEARVRKGE